MRGGNFDLEKRGSETKRGGSSASRDEGGKGVGLVEGKMRTRAKTCV